MNAGQEKMKKKKQLHRDLSSDGKDLWKNKTHIQAEREQLPEEKKRMDLAKPKQNKVPY